MLALEEKEEEEDKSKFALAEPIVRSFNVTAFRLRILELVLGASVRLGIVVEGTKGEEPFQEYKELVVDGDDYAAWGVDDSYLVEFVKSRIPTLF